MPKATSAVHRCGFCRKKLPSAKGVTIHIQKTLECRRRWELELDAQPAQSLLGRLDAAASHKSATTTYDEDIPCGEPEVPMHDSISAMHEQPRPNPTSSASTSQETLDERYLQRFVQIYPGEAAEIVRKGTSAFEQWRRENVREERTRWYPFASKEEWELAAWLAENVGQNKIEEFLKLEMVRRTFENMSHDY